MHQMRGVSQAYNCEMKITHTSAVLNNNMVEFLLDGEKIITVPLLNLDWLWSMKLEGDLEMRKKFWESVSNSGNGKRERESGGIIQMRGVSRAFDSEVKITHTSAKLKADIVEFLIDDEEIATIPLIKIDSIWRSNFKGDLEARKKLWESYYDTHDKPSLRIVR